MSLSWTRKRWVEDGYPTAARCCTGRRGVCSPKSRCGGTASSTHVPSSVMRIRARNESAAAEWAAGPELKALEEEG
jgi:hypothetical protein